MHGQNLITHSHQTTARKDRSPQNPEEGKMKKTAVNDFQEASYLVAQGCVIEFVFLIPFENGYAWSIDLSGEGIEAMRELYRKKEAVVNVHAFLCARDSVKKAIDAERARGNA
jgi:hypothetical protein